MSRGFLFVLTWIFNTLGYHGFFGDICEMKHHFGDFLDREGDYWTIVPNVERYAYSASDEIVDKSAVKLLTISKHDENWEQVFECYNIEELTLHDPSKEQVQSIDKLTQLKRLRVTFFRANDIEFIGNLSNLEELVLEYVSGFSDLKPLQNLKKIKSVHFENLRRVSNFDGLKNIESLRYLHIDGTFDWKQPIENFNFLEGLPNLEVFSLGFVITKSEFPVFLPILKLKNLKKIKIGRATFNVKEYAFLEAAFPNVEGCSWELCWMYDSNFEFLGKGGGRININSPKAKERCDEFIESYQKMKIESEKMIDSYLAN